MLQPNWDVREDTVSALNDSNEIQVAKISCLSSKHAHKAYSSMVAFLRKGSEAERFFNEGFINVGGESASVRIFEPSFGPPRCYNYPGSGCKAFSCKEIQRCENCAQTGHEWTNCKAEPKCVSCSEFHSVASRHCTSSNGS